MWIAGKVPCADFLLSPLSFPVSSTIKKKPTQISFKFISCEQGWLVYTGLVFNLTTSCFNWGAEEKKMWLSLIKPRKCSQCQLCGQRVFIHRMQIRIAKTFLKHSSYWYSSRSNNEQRVTMQIFSRLGLEHDLLFISCFILHKSRLSISSVYQSRYS